MKASALFLVAFLAIAQAAVLLEDEGVRKQQQPILCQPGTLDNSTCVMDFVGHGAAPSVETSKSKKKYLQEQKKVKKSKQHANFLKCHEKYDEESLVLMKQRFLDRIRRRGTAPKVFIAGMLHNSGELVEGWVSSVQRFVDRLGAENSFVSVLESGSKDATPIVLERFRKKLASLAVQHNISTRANIVQPVFKEGVASSGNRIDYLAKLRNLVLDSLYAQPGVYDSVVFLNDVFVCEGDIWRLLSHEADLACGFDFKGGSGFWDNWVYEGQKLPPECMDHLHASYQKCHAETPFQVGCCWNGMAAINAKAFEGDHGVRFRRGTSTTNDCQASECSLLCRDMNQLGFKNVIADPSVQLGYHEEDRVSRRTISKGTIQGESLAPAKLPQAWKCCPLPKDGQKHVHWEQCHMQQEIAEAPAVKAQKDIVMIRAKSVSPENLMRREFGSPDA